MGVALHEEPSFWAEVVRSVVASSAVTGAGWGALGGATSALAVGGGGKKAAVRQVLMGALVAGGTGTLGMAIFAKSFGLDAALIPLVGAGSSASYFAGVFGPAVIEVLLSRIHAGRLPGEDKEDG